MPNPIFAAMHNLKIVAAILLLVSLTACNMKKVSKVTVQNNNAVPHSLSIQANNISLNATNIAAGQSIEQDWEWSNIDKKDGEHVFILKDAKGNVLGNYPYGAFEKGELHGYYFIIIAGDSLNVKIEN
jgi:hypothetical protein